MESGAIYFRIARTCSGVRISTSKRNKYARWIRRQQRGVLTGRQWMGRSITMTVGKRKIAIKMVIGNWWPTLSHESDSRPGSALMIMDWTGQNLWLLCLESAQGWRHRRRNVGSNFGYFFGNGKGCHMLLYRPLLLLPLRHHGQLQEKEKRGIHCWLRFPGIWSVATFPIGWFKCLNSRRRTSW